MDQQEVGDVKETLRSAKKVDQCKAELAESDRKRLRGERKALLVDHDSQCT
jgi:hypothetical protein